MAAPKMGMPGCCCDICTSSFWSNPIYITHALGSLTFTGTGTSRDADGTYSFSNITCWTPPNIQICVAASSTSISFHLECSGGVLTLKHVISIQQCGGPRSFKFVDQDSGCYNGFVGGAEIYPAVIGTVSSAPFAASGTWAAATSPYPIVSPLAGTSWAISS